MQTWFPALAVPLFSLGLNPAQASSQPPAPAAHFAGGMWFNGNTFVRDDFYVVDGLLTHAAPAPVGTTIDLHGGFVVPPFGDAHEHNFDSVRVTPQVTALYLRDGVFYAQGVTDVTAGAADVVAAKLVNTPQTVDVTYAHGGLTGPNGHPKEIYEQYALGFYNNPVTEEQRAKIEGSHSQAGQAYWEIDRPATLAAVWPKILAAKPDLIKVYLLHSEGFAAQSKTHPPMALGIDPALVPAIVARAHAAGLKVAAHIDTAADFHVAVTAGVDEMAHLPGYFFAPGETLASCRLPDADIAEAARKHLRVIATASLGAEEPAAEQAMIRQSQTDNLSRLKQAGVAVLVGSDHYAEDSRIEARYLKELGIWTNLELLRMYSVITPKDIFPRRKIGELRDGYEASFLVLKSDPLVDWKATEQIADRWKQGVHLAVAERAAAAKTP